MKNDFKRILIAAALVTALVLGVAALAETAEPETPQLPAIEGVQPDTGENTLPDTGEAPADDDSAALQEALEAYRSARQASRMESVEEELDAFVADGKLTREQADRILEYYKEQDSMRNGTCPNCGYAFQGGRGGKGGKGMRGMNGMNGRNGMNGMNGMNGRNGCGGMGGKGMRGMNGMNGGAQQPSQDGSAPDGASFQQGLQAMPNPSQANGI